ncbi:MAG: class I SAM-dependent methyltransferase [bacterium]
MAIANKGKSSCSPLFEDIHDQNILSLLKNFPRSEDGMNVPPADGRLLYDLILEKGYTRGLEIGTSNGFSALWLGLAFRQTGGTLITLENDSERAEQARVNFKQAGLDQVIYFRICDALKEIPLIKDRFDFVFIDAWKDDYLKYFQLVRSRIIPRGVIAAHNVDDARQEMADFLDEIASDTDFTTSIERTSSAGISLSFNKENK